MVLQCKRKAVAVPREGIIRGSASNVPGTGMEEIFLVLDPPLVYVTSSRVLNIEDALARDLKRGRKHCKRRI